MVNQFVLTNAPTVGDGILLRSLWLRLPRYAKSDGNGLFLRFTRRNLCLYVLADGLLATGLDEWHIIVLSVAGIA